MPLIETHQLPELAILSRDHFPGACNAIVTKSKASADRTEYIQKFKKQFKTKLIPKLNDEHCAKDYTERVNYQTIRFSIIRLNSLYVVFANYACFAIAFGHD
jgi:hypothetical protein